MTLLRSVANGTGWSMNTVLKVLSLVIFLLPVGAARGEDLLIKAGKVYTMTGPPLAPGLVHVADGKIVAVGTDLKTPDGAKVIDLSSGVLMQGLVDAYSHTGITGRNAEMTREITPKYRVLTAVDWRSRAFRAALADGTTCLGLAPGTDGVFAGLSCAVKTAGTQRVLQ